MTVSLCLSLSLSVFLSLSFPLFWTNNTPQSICGDRKIEKDEASFMYVQLLDKPIVCSPIQKEGYLVAVVGTFIGGV